MPLPSSRPFSDAFRQGAGARGRHQLAPLASAGTTAGQKRTPETLQPTFAMFLPTSLIARLDPWCIAPYRWLPDSPEASFFLGTFLLAAQAALLGLLTLRLGVRMHAGRLRSLRDDMTRYHKLGERALREQGKETFKAVNRQAHEAFGYYFSLNGALWVASLWPVPPVLAWMQPRFLEASPTLPFALPLFGAQPGYVFWFILCYIPARLLVGRCLPPMGRDADATDAPPGQK